MNNLSPRGLKTTRTISGVDCPAIKRRSALEGSMAPAINNAGLKIAGFVTISMPGVIWVPRYQSLSPRSWLAFSSRRSRRIFGSLVPAENERSMEPGRS
jgi:hypothetical protein